jgi:hypothetical protein
LNYGSGLHAFWLLFLAGNTAAHCVRKQVYRIDCDDSQKRMVGVICRQIVKVAQTGTPDATQIAKHIRILGRN